MFNRFLCAGMSLFLLKLRTIEPFKASGLSTCRLLLLLLCCRSGVDVKKGLLLAGFVGLKVNITLCSNRKLFYALLKAQKIKENYNCRFETIVGLTNFRQIMGR